MTFSKDSRSEYYAAAINLYQKVRDSGLIPESHSFQMEFSIKDKQDLAQIYFLQARLHRPFIEAVEIPKLAGRIPVFNGLGITPEEGLLLPLGKATAQDMKRLQGEAAAAYVHNGSNRRSPPSLDFHPKNMTAYVIPGGTQGNAQNTHGHYRFLNKAPVVCVIGFMPDEMKKRINNKTMVRILSNGFNSAAKFEE